MNNWGFVTWAEGGSPRWLCDYQRVLVNAFVDIELTGFPFDEVAHQQFVRKADLIYREYERKILSNPRLKDFLEKTKKEGFKVTSTADLVEFMFSNPEGLCLEPVKLSSKTSAPSTDKESLKALADQGLDFAKDVLVFRNFGKLISAFGDPLLKFYNRTTGAVHPNYYLAKVIDEAGKEGGTHTGRLSCARPNLQQLPKRDKDDTHGVAGIEVRRSFIPFPGHILVEIDQSQIEVRVAGMYAQDEQMGEFFKLGGDFHTRVASNIHRIKYEDMYNVLESPSHPLKSDYKAKRAAAKTIVFGLLYGMGIPKLIRQCKMTEEEGELFIEQFFDLFPRLASWREEMIAKAARDGRVRTLFGRERYLAVRQLRSSSGKEQRLGVNTPIQSAAADITLYALARIWEHMFREGFESRILGTVHDSIVFSMDPKEMPELLRWVVDTMIYPPGLEWLLDAVPIPLSVEVDAGLNWKDIKTVPLADISSGRVDVNRLLKA